MPTATAPPPTPDRALDVLAEGVGLQYESMPNAYIASGVMATVVAAIFQQSMPTAIWVAWLAAMYVHVIARWRLRQRFLQVRPAAHDIARWGRYAVIGTSASGVLWGVGTVLGLTYSKGAMEFLLVPLILLISVAAVISAISYIAVYYAFVVPATLPGIIVFLLDSDTLRLLTGVAYLCFLFMMTRFAHVLHESFMTSTRLRFENSALVEALQREKAAAVEANQAKSRFLAAASHDLRQPMHALSLFMASFPARRLEPEEANILGNMRRSADAMGMLFDALLDMSRLDAGVVEPRARHFEAGPFASRLYHEHSPLATARGLQMRLRTADAVVFADPVLLNRIISNLLSNAVRHGARQGVLLALRPRRGRLAIEVWDTGVGIAQQDRQAIFQEFFQIGNPERDREKGLGLGLAIVDRLVRLMGLELELQSRPGVGSLFRLYVPLGQRALVTFDPTGSVPREQSREQPLELSVEVIDDERAVREATRLLLTQWGCEVSCAASLSEVLARPAGSTRPPDLVIADLRLRDGADGIAAIRALRIHHGREIPGIIITGDTWPERLNQVRDSGLPLLHKPVNPGALRALITAQLARH